METSEIIKIISIIIALAVAIIGHEIMHGLTAYRYGDDTAKNQGRLSPNPLIHVDPVGTIIVPGLLYFTGGFLFGWAKPVPIYIRTVIRNGGYLGAIFVSLAGIAYNFTIATLAALILRILPEPNSLFYVFIYALFYYLVVINIVLGVFNLYPLPPLDGFHAVTYLCAWMGWSKLANMFDKISRGNYGMIILILIIATPASQYFFIPMRYLMTLFLP